MEIDRLDPLCIIQPFKEDFHTTIQDSDSLHYAAIHTIRDIQSF